MFQEPMHILPLFQSTSKCQSYTNLLQSYILCFQPEKVTYELVVKCYYFKYGADEMCYCMNVCTYIMGHYTWVQIGHSFFAYLTHLSFLSQQVLESWRNKIGKSQWGIQLKQIRLCTEIGIECIDVNRANRPDTSHIINRLGETENKCMVIGMSCSTFVLVSLFVECITKFNAYFEYYFTCVNFCLEGKSRG